MLRGSGAYFFSARSAVAQNLTITIFVIFSQKNHIPTPTGYNFLICFGEWGVVAEDLKILQKIFDMMEYGYQALAQYPKSEKFALVTDIKRSMDTMLERCIEAQKKYYKKTTLQDMDVEIMKLRAYLRLSFQLGFLPMKKYEIWSGKVVEIGKMLGGWLKAVNGKKPS